MGADQRTIKGEVAIVGVGETPYHKGQMAYTGPYGLLSHAGLALAEELGLDYPHHEGSWPHSAEAIERQMAHLRDDSRAKILGLNAARLFKLEVPLGKAS